MRILAQWAWDWAAKQQRCLAAPSRMKVMVDTRTYEHTCACTVHCACVSEK